MRDAPARCECSCNSMKYDRCAGLIVFRVTASRVRPATVLAVTVGDAECGAPRGSRIAALLEWRDGALFARPIEA